MMVVADWEHRWSETKRRARLMCTQSGAILRLAGHQLSPPATKEHGARDGLDHNLHRSNDSLVNQQEQHRNTTGTIFEHIDMILE